MPRGGRSCAERREKQREKRQERRDRQAAAASLDEAEESDATEEDATGGTTARWQEGCSENSRARRGIFARENLGAHHTGLLRPLVF